MLARGNGRGPRNVLIDIADGTRVVATRFSGRRLPEPRQHSRFCVWSTAVYIAGIGGFGPCRFFVSGSLSRWFEWIHSLDAGIYTVVPFFSPPGIGWVPLLFKRFGNADRTTSQAEASKRIEDGSILHMVNGF